jgi:hypothetical protein
LGSLKQSLAAGWRNDWEGGIEGVDFLQKRDYNTNLLGIRLNSTNIMLLYVDKLPFFPINIYPTPV